MAGIFVKEHAKAASLYNDIVVLYAYPDPSPERWKLYRISEDIIEDGIRTIRVKYGGGFFSFQRKLYTGGQAKGVSSALRSRPAAPLRRLLRIPNMIVTDLLYYWAILACFRKLVKEGWRAEVIHAHVFTAGMPAVILGKLYRIPVVITEHSSSLPRRLLTLPERLKARFAMNKARVILPVSDDLRKHIEAYGVRNRFHIVPNVVNTETFYPPPMGEESRDGKKRILLVAVLTPIKGVPYLLEAMSQIKEDREDFVLDIVGDGPNRSEYKELATKLGLDGIVKFHGLKLKEEVAEFMRRCDFLVLPSLWENLPVVLIEAMACGKSVIATDVGGVKEIINEELGILIPSKDVESLREALEFMLDAHSNYSPEKIARYARERFSYEAVGKMLDEIYRQMQRGRGRLTR